MHLILTGYDQVLGLFILQIQQSSMENTLIKRGCDEFKRLQKLWIKSLSSQNDECYSDSNVEEEYLSSILVSSFKEIKNHETSKSNNNSSKLLVKLPMKCLKKLSSHSWILHGDGWELSMCRRCELDPIISSLADNLIFNSSNSNITGAINHINVDLRIQNYFNLTYNDIINHNEIIRNNKEITENDYKIVVIGNPPFSYHNISNNENGVIDDKIEDYPYSFLMHSCKEINADRIVFLLPKRCNNTSFIEKCESNMNLFPKDYAYWILIHSEIADPYFDFMEGAIFNGSFLVPFKTLKIQLDPLLYIQYVSIGIFLTCWISNSFLSVNKLYVSGGDDEFYFVSLAFMGGIILGCSITLSFLTAEKIGVALATGIFGGTGILTAYIWSVAAFEEYPTNDGYAVGGLILLLIGVFGIAFCNYINDNISNNILNNADKSSLETNLNASPIHESILDSTGLESNSSLSKKPTTLSIDSTNNPNRTNYLLDNNNNNNNKNNEAIKYNDFSLGILYGILTGLSGGTQLVPLHYVISSHSGLVLLPAFGTGVLITTPILLLLTIYSQLKENEELFSKIKNLSWQLKDTLLLGILSGILWSLNNICIIPAIPIIGYGVSFAIVQCAILIGGLWGFDTMSKSYQMD
eukprot:gene5328-7394_t